MRLFCFPYAGGGPSIYRGWEHYLPQGLEVWPAQPPGRGSRYKEQPYSEMRTLIDSAAAAIEPFLDLPISLFGHSVGAIASFELAHKLKRDFDFDVSHLFVSGSPAPQLPRRGPRLRHLPEDEFITELKSLNGTPPEILENPELMQMIIGTLRADFAIAETYSFSGGPPLACPITAFGGFEDDLASHEDLEAWKIQTTGAFDLWELPGDHFFVHTSESLILQVLSRETKRLMTRQPAAEAATV